MSNSVRSYIALGSNLEEPIQQIKTAINELNQLNNTQFHSVSSLYSSTPMGPAGQPDYINAVAALDTTLSPHELLNALQIIEHKHGRKRTIRWGARTLDLDILLYGEERVNTDDLTIPHIGMRERSFVLYPLAEIAPELVLPSGDKLKQVLETCSEDGLTRL